MRLVHNISIRPVGDQFEAHIQEIDITVTGATEQEAMTEAQRAIMHSMIEEYEKQKRDEMDRSL